MEDKIREFITGQLVAMSDGVARNYDTREQSNPFLAFKGENSNKITKYMSLGRSFDSQLGNRLQKICMFLARCRYGVEAVPNYIFVSANANKIYLWLFSYPEEFVEKYGVDVYKTQSVISVGNKNDVADMLIKKVKIDIKKSIERNIG